MLAAAVLLMLTPGGLALADEAVGSGKLIVEVVEFAITPGKPGAPTESIVLQLEGQSPRIIVTRTSGDGQELAKGDSELTAASVAPVLKVIDQGALVSFKPQPESGKTFDFGKRRLGLVLCSDSTCIEHAVSWEKPLENDATIKKLLAHLAGLAREHVPSVELYYFPRTQRE